MAANSENADRRVVPRWRTFREALATYELSPTTVAKVPGIDGKAFLHEKEVLWQTNHELTFAVDLVSAANVLGNSDVAKEAAEFILENEGSTSHMAHELARAVLGVPEVSTALPSTQVMTRGDVVLATKLLKSRRLTQPRNAFVWLDLARLYVLLGQMDPAEQALRVALGLAPSERFILRSAVRFFLHRRDPGQALQLLRNNPRTPFDPWLISAEIAVSSVVQKSPKFGKIGQSLLDQSGVSPFHMSELACALGSLAMFDGNSRKANRLFESSLREPTDNALAQVVWAGHRTGLELSNRKLLKTPNAHEALTIDAHNRGHWKDLVVHAERWAQDESFSVRPRMIASGTASSLLGEFKLGENVARAGLETNPGHPGLLNNIAFALINQGKPAEALKVIEQVSKNQLTPIHSICLLATIGMAHYRLGNADEGLSHYRMAIDSAGKYELMPLKTLATLYLARERVLQGNPEGAKEFRKAREAAKKFAVTHVPAIADFLSAEILDKVVALEKKRKSPAV